MSLIEGVGDEVTNFFIAVIVILIGVLAWWSTSLAQRPLIRTVLILEHRTRTQTPQAVPSSHTIRARDREVNTERTDDDPPERRDRGDAGSSTAAVNENDERERDDIVKAMDSDSNIVRKRRLAFFKNQTTDAHVNDEPDDAVINNDAEPKTETESQGGDVDQIRIKLKYLNDDLKLVRGNLREQLGEFKRRHFEVELGARKLVRLIFNGQVLQEDSETLEKYGLFDNCVVHCLVHQAPASASAAVPNETVNRVASNDRSANPRTTHRHQRMRDTSNLHWDLGNLLFLLITLILVIAWYFRYEYAHLFTITATVGLVCLTGIFTLLIIGLFFPMNAPQPVTVNAGGEHRTIETVATAII